ncbi:ubiquinol oxidase subunit II [Candidatus Williamhamiltonella defendens]|uniref:ubiquinol oxidase subunit II n=1 Tax=Candidatus Williamhamiltonella defendens TaxID=138072 RepID=UPI00130D74AC|nr:ubiquinol oxidase subunit II [Candidatus Hamiltonella defensa]
MIIKKLIKCLSLLSIFIGPIILSGCDVALMNPQGAIGIEQKKLILTSVGLMLIVVIPVILMVFIFAWKYRESNKKATYSPNWSHSYTIESVVWIIPIIIIAILGVITWKSAHELDPYKPIVNNKLPMTIEVISLDWKWLFIYPKEGIATVNQLAFPMNMPIHFKITSDSVMNSFFIPQLGSQIYAMPGMQAQVYLIANKPGQYEGISSSYSGRGFSGMKFMAIATKDESDFQHWVSEVKKSPHTLNTFHDFNRLAQPSDHHPMTYFSVVKPFLFQDIIKKFMGDMNMHQNIDMHQTHQALHSIVEE